MYWILWFILQIVFTVLFARLFVYKLVINTLRFVKGYAKTSAKVIRLIAVSLIVAFAVFVVTFSTATIVLRSKFGFVIGRTDKVTPFIAWPLFIFGGVSVVTFVITMTLSRKYLTVSCDNEEFKPLNTSDDKNWKDKIVRALPTAVCALAVLAACVPISFAVDYVLLKLFTVSVTKKLILLAVAIEVLIVCSIIFFMRKKIKGLKIYALTATILLFAALMVYYIMLVAASADTVEKAFVCFGSFLSVAVPLLTTVLILSARVKDISDFNSIAKKEILEK